MLSSMCKPHCSHAAGIIGSWASQTLIQGVWLYVVLISSEAFSTLQKASASSGPYCSLRDEAALRYGTWSHLVALLCSQPIPACPSHIVESLDLQGDKSVFPLWIPEGGMGQDEEEGLSKEHLLPHSRPQEEKLPAQPVKHCSSTREQGHVQDTGKASMKFAVGLLVHVRSHPWLVALPLSNYPLGLPQLSPVLCIYLRVQLPGSVLRNCG